MSLVKVYKMYSKNTNLVHLTNFAQLLVRRTNNYYMITWRPPNLTKLTHIGSEASIYQFTFYNSNSIKTIHYHAINVLFSKQLDGFHIFTIAQVIPNTS